MKSVVKIILWVLEFILGIIFVLYSIFATMLISVSKDGIIKDGFGRILQPAPIWFPIGENYAGFGWLIFDTALAFAIIIVMYIIYLIIKKLKRTSDPEINK